MIAWNAFIDYLMEALICSCFLLHQFIKNMKNHILILLAILLPCFGIAQTQTIRGRVINKDTQQPIGGATLVVQDLTPVKGAVTDENGTVSNIEIDMTE